MYWELAAFLVRRRIPLEAMVTHRFGIEDAPEAFRLADAGRTGKIVFEWK
jgi:propanol-preferring alcohol dehydrogenase